MPAVCTTLEGKKGGTATNCTAQPKESEVIMTQISNYVFPITKQDVRTVTEGSDVLFVAKDVAELLQYSNTSDAISRHCKGSRETRPLQTPQGVQELRVISESDMLRLVIGSKMPEAELFEKWVFEEVLPSIRKTGKYETPEHLRKQSEALSLFKLMLEGYALTDAPTSFAQSESAKRVLHQTGVNLLGTLDRSPGQEDIPDDQILLAPRNLAYYLSDYLDDPITDREVNNLLCRLEYQTSRRGNPRWVATEKGEAISYQAMFNSERGNGYHIKWNKLEVWDIFIQHQEERKIKAKLAYEERRFQQEQAAAKEEHEAKMRQLERESAAEIYSPPVELEHFSLSRNG